MYSFLSAITSTYRYKQFNSFAKIIEFGKEKNFHFLQMRTIRKVSADRFLNRIIVRINQKRFHQSTHLVIAFHMHDVTNKCLDVSFFDKYLLQRLWMVIELR